MVKEGNRRVECGTTCHLICFLNFSGLLGNSSAVMFIRKLCVCVLVEGEDGMDGQ